MAQMSAEIDRQRRVKKLVIQMFTQWQISGSVKKWITLFEVNFKIAFHDQNGRRQQQQQQQ